MSDIVRSAEEAIKRLEQYDSSLEWIDLVGKRYTDTKLAELIDCLIVHPDFVTRVYLGDNQLTDETGVKLARYVAASSTIVCLDLCSNLISPATYLALAAAFRINTSLQFLFLVNNHAKDKSRINAAFVEALHLNPIRSNDSKWYLYTYSSKFSRLQSLAKQLGPPSMLSQLDACETWHKMNKFHTL